MADLVMVGEGAQQGPIGFSVRLLDGFDRAGFVVKPESLIDVGGIKRDTDDRKTLLLVRLVPFAQAFQKGDTGAGANVAEVEQHHLAPEGGQLDGLAVDGKVRLEVGSGS